MKRGRAPTSEKALVLGLETATRYGGAAVVSPDGLLGEIVLLNPESHSERLMPAVETLLKSLALTPSALSGLAVSAGPGSFTGLRIGVSSAKGLSFSLGLPLYGLPTLETLAANCLSAEGAVAAFIDARRGEYAFAVFRNHRGKLTEVRKAALARPGAIPELLPPEAVLVGEVPDLLREEAGRSRKRRFRLAPPHLNYPRAAVVAARGLRMLLAGRPSETETLRPIYFRPPDAEAESKVPSPRPA